MSTTSRNELCPCGSGKKYKRCCLGNAEPATTDTGRLAHVRNATERALFDRILAWADRRFGRSWPMETLRCCGDHPPSQEEMQFLIPWLVHLMPMEDDSPTGQFFIERGAQLSELERECALASVRSRLGYWEVRRVEPGVGVELFNLLTHETRFVHEVRASHTLRRWHVLLAAVTNYPEVNVFMGLHPTALMPGDAAELVATIRRALGVGKRPVLKVRFGIPELQLAMVRIWREAAMDVLERASRPPELSNTDGDPLVICTDHFALESATPEATLALLGRMTGADLNETDSGDEVVFTRPGDKRHGDWGNTIVGRAIVRRGRLLVETNSLKRADALRDRIQETAGAQLRHLMRDVQDAAHLLGTSPGEDRLRKTFSAAPPEVQEQMRQIVARHWEAWLDDKLPVLGGRTPREAAASVRLRPRLIALLKEFEIREAAKLSAERYDMSRLWSGLAIDPNEKPAPAASTVGRRRTQRRNEPAET